MTLRTTINADLQTIFDGGFCLTATHYYGETNESLNVMWDDIYSGASLINVEVEQSEAAILLATADMSNVSRASSFSISGVTYYVREIETDRDGVTRVTLSKVAR